ncbi:MAG: hypothetical protein IJK66_06110 [Bacilli bacterium]|nr:hypothetical protein [Bacilli bacterium]
MREEALMLSEDELMSLNTIDEVINYIIQCGNNGRNVYYVHNGVSLYSCDNYSFDEYYLLATGLSKSDKQNLDEIIYGKNGSRNASHEDLVALTDLVLPIYSYLIKMNELLVEELKNGKPKTNNGFSV